MKRSPPRKLYCPKCGYETMEEDEFPWFVRFGVACCEGRGLDKPHSVTFMLLAKDKDNGTAR